MIKKVLPKVLFLKGVFKKDCVTDEDLEKKFSEESDDVIEIKNDFVALPYLYEGLDSWVKQTNVCCWNCTLQFESIPIFIPKSIEPVISKENIKRYSIGVYGTFCSFTCAKEFILIRIKSITEQVEQLNKLRFLHSQMFGLAMNEDLNKYSIFDMLQYGGTITTEYYKNEVNKLRTDKELQHNKLKLSCMHGE